MDEEGQRGGSRVSGESVLQGGEVCVLKCCEELISESSVNVKTFFVLSTLFGVLEEERLLVEGGCPRRDVGCATGASWADKWVSGGKGVLSSRQDKPKVAVLGPAAD